VRNHGTAGAARAARTAAIAAVVLAAEPAPHPIEQALALARVAGRARRATGAGTAGRVAATRRGAAIAAVVLAEAIAEAIPPRRLLAAAIATGRAATGLAGRLAARSGLTAGGCLAAVVTLAAFHLVAQTAEPTFVLATVRTRSTRPAGAARTAAATRTMGRGRRWCSRRGGGAVSACKPRGSHQQKSGIHLLSSDRGCFRLGVEHGGPLLPPPRRTHAFFLFPSLSSLQAVSLVSERNRGLAEF
jgi:hypothetical protein